MRQTLALALGLAVFAGAAQAQNDDTNFKWNGQVPRGQWVHVRNLNGPITVKAATGNQVEITAVKRVRRGDPSSVRIVATPTSGGGIVVCAFWSENATCDEDGYRSHGNDGRRGNENQVSVEFTVALPAGVHVGVSSVNGDVEVDGATAEVQAGSVNGDVRALSNGGPVSASTVNGSVTARMRTLPTDSDLRFSTVNGSIDIELPAQLDADVELRTVNGSFRTDFPMTLTGRVSPRNLRGTIGKGGRQLKATTVNGSIDLKKAS